MSKVASVQAERAARKQPNWWLRATSCWDRPVLTTEDRESLRRSTLASWLILGLLGGVVIASPLVVVDLPSLIGIAAIAVIALVAAALNRLGYVTATGVLLTMVIIAAPLSAITPEQMRPGGGLDLDALPVFDLLALAVLFAASLLKPIAGFWLAGINILLMILDFSLQPHDPYLQRELETIYGGNFEGTVILLVRPAGLQVVVATIAYLWVRGVQRASVRADLAEQELTLQQRYEALNRRLLTDLERFLDSIKNAIANLANNKLTFVPIPSDPRYAEAAPFFNDQLAKLYKLKQERMLVDPLLVPAVNQLLAALRKITATQPGSGDWSELLHPYHFKTGVPIVDEMAHIVYNTLHDHLMYAFTHPVPRKQHADPM